MASLVFCRRWLEDYQWIFGGLSIGIYVTSFVLLLVGSQLGRINRWILIVLALLYLVDAGIAYWLEDYMGLLIHAVPMFMLVRAIYSHFKLDGLVDKDAVPQELRLGSIDLTPIKAPLTVLFGLTAVAWVGLLAVTVFLLSLFS